MVVLVKNGTLSVPGIFGILGRDPNIEKETFRAKHVVPNT